MLGSSAQFWRTILQLRIDEGHLGLRTPAPEYFTCHSELEFLASAGELGSEGFLKERPHLGRSQLIAIVNAHH